jgi:hypothetical protein
MGQDSARQVGIREIVAGQAAGRYDAVQVRPDIGVRSPPLVPWVGTLAENCRMRWLGHSRFWIITSHLDFTSRFEYTKALDSDFTLSGQLFPNARTPRDLY